MAEVPALRRCDGCSEPNRCGCPRGVAMAAGFVAALEDVGLLMAERDRLAAQLAAVRGDAAIDAAAKALSQWPKWEKARYSDEGQGYLVAARRAIDAALLAASPSTPEVGHG